MLIELNNDFHGLRLGWTYYLSGPMMGYPDNNFPMFESAAKALRVLGLKILSPHEIKHEGNDLIWQDYLRGDLIPMLQQCNGIILLPGWPQSKGARMELDVALKLDWTVFYLKVREEEDRGELINMNRKAA